MKMKKVHWLFYPMEVGLPVSCWFVDLVTDGVVVKLTVVDFARVVCACVVNVCAPERFLSVCAWVYDKINVCVVADIVDLVSKKLFLTALE